MTPQLVAAIRTEPVDENELVDVIASVRRPGRFVARETWRRTPPAWTATATLRRWPRSSATGPRAPPHCAGRRARAGRQRARRGGGRGAVHRQRAPRASSSDAGLIAVESHGRHRYFRLAGPDVARALEALARIALPAPVRSLREGTRAHAIRRARTCYDHLAGRLGVAMMAGMLDDGVLAAGDGRHDRGRARGRPPVRGRPRPRLPPHRGRRRAPRATSASTSTARWRGRARRSATASTGASRTTTSRAQPGPPRWPPACSSCGG